MSNNKTTKVVFNSFTFICAVCTAIIGYTINNGSIFWTIIDYMFWPVAIIKWLICHQLCMSVVKDAFSFFMK